MLMGGGVSFVGVSGDSYSAGPDLIEIGGGDVRMALMNGWVQPDDPPAGVWRGENHPDMLAMKLKEMEARISALEATAKPASVAP